MRTPARTWVVPDGPDGNLLFLFLLLMQAASGLAAASIDPFLTCAASGKPAPLPETDFSSLTRSFPRRARDGSNQVRQVARQGIYLVHHAGT
jgi:hypothetical protein